MPVPVAFYPLNARYKAAEKENRQPEGILRNVAITNGPYNEPGGAYMFYGTVNSYIEFPKKRGPYGWFSVTLMCWVQPGGQNGPLFSYEFFYPRVGIRIKYGRFFFTLRYRSFAYLTTPEVLPVGKWVHVAASYDHNTGNSSLYINGLLRASRFIGRYFYMTMITVARTIRMGSDLYGRDHFKGKIAEMKVYDVALKEVQIQTSIRQGSFTFP